MRKLYKSDQIALDSIEAYYCSCSCSSCSCSPCGCSCSGDLNKQMSNQGKIAYDINLEYDNRNRITAGPMSLYR